MCQTIPLPRGKSYLLTEKGVIPVRPNLQSNDNGVFYTAFFPLHLMGKHQKLCCGFCFVMWSQVDDEYFVTESPDSFWY